MFRFTEDYGIHVRNMVAGIETAKALAEKNNFQAEIILKKYPHNREFKSIINACNDAIKDKIDVVIGGEESSHALVMAKLLGNAKIPFITPTATNPEVTRLSDRTFAISMSDSEVSRLLANFILKKKVKKIGIMRGISSPYTDFLSAEFYRHLSTSAQTPHIEVVKFVNQTYNFRSTIERWKEENITHVAMLSYGESFVQFWAQCNEIGYHPVFLGSDGWGDSETLQKKLFSKNSKKTNSSIAYQSSFWRQNADHKLAITFRNLFEKMHKVKANSWNAVSFDAAHILFTAANSIQGPINKDTVTNAIKNVGTIETVTSPTFKFDSSRSPIKKLAIYRIEKKGTTFEMMIP